MPIYGTREELEKLRKNQWCSICGARANLFADGKIGEAPKFYLACWDYPRSHHEGLTRHTSEYQKKGMDALNIVSRREIMVSQIGEVKTRALEKYAGVTALTRVQAKEIINTIWPEAEKAAPAEVYKAIMLCEQYQLNPLKRHLFLIPYWNSDKKRYDYVTVQGIGADRLIASRKHDWTFLDDTPRIGTDEEINKHYGKTADPDRLYCIAKIRDLKTGKEVTAWGEYPIYKIDKQGSKVLNHPKGEDKGNSMLNMCCIHTERKGLDMLYPADMPGLNVPVIDEKYESFPGDDEPSKVTVTEIKHVVDDMTEAEYKEAVTEQPPEVTKQEKATGQVPANLGALYTWVKGELKKTGNAELATKFVEACGVSDADLRNVAKAYELVRKQNPEWGEYTPEPKG